MYILFGDETNIDVKTPNFFIYGGIFFKLDQISQINAEIEILRKKYKLDTYGELKWNRNKNCILNSEDYSKLKLKVIEIGKKYNVKFLVHIIYTETARKLYGKLKNKLPDDPFYQDKNDDKHENFLITTFAVDAILKKYNHYLKKHKGKGICVLDHRSEDYKKYFCTKYRKGLYDSPSESWQKLNNIELFCESYSNASNVNSLVDIILGGFRFIVNSRTNPINNITQNLYDSIYPITLHIDIRPSEKYRVKYEKDYKVLLSYLNDLNTYTELCFDDF